MKLAIILPTLGRATLPRAIASAMHQLDADTTIEVVGDGHRPDAEAAVDEVRDPRVRYSHHSDPVSMFGNAQRNHGIARSGADWIMHLDDDDKLLDGAVAAVRRNMRFHKPLVFRMLHYGKVLWREPVMQFGNVGGAQLACPRDQLKPWGIGNGSDFDCIVATVNSHGIRWCCDVIYNCEEHHGGK